ncbi:MAG: V-type ATP synthase subunit C [Eubacteriaceae bacterium]|nr:V-type ATP synthase subunit C [Eubacteriaceae bacterium]
MDKLIYTQAISRLKVLETRLIERTKMDRMIDASSAEEAMKILQESEYSIHLGKIKRAEEYEVVLKDELKRIYSLMYEVTPVKQLIDIMSLRYDYHNIKVLLKAKELKTPLDHLLIDVGTIPTEKMKVYLENEDYTDFNPIMREGIEKTLIRYRNDLDPQMIDINLDAYMYKHMVSQADELGEGFISKFLKISIDLINLKTMFRVKKQNKEKDFLETVILQGGILDKDVFMNSLNDSMDNLAQKLSYTDYYNILRLSVEDYLKTGKINTFEKLSDDFIMEYIKKSKFMSFGPEPLLAYLTAKETEIKNIRIIMVGKLNKVAPESIRERLRETYV